MSGIGGCCSPIKKQNCKFYFLIGLQQHDLLWQEKIVQQLMLLSVRKQNYQFYFLIGLQQPPIPLICPPSHTQAFSLLSPQNCLYYPQNCLYYPQNHLKVAAKPQALHIINFYLVLWISCHRWILIQKFAFKIQPLLNIFIGPDELPQMDFNIENCF